MLSENKTSVLKALAVKLVWNGRARVCTGRLIFGGVIGGLLDAGVSSRLVVVAHGSGDARFGFWLLGFRSWAFGPLFMSFCCPIWLGFVTLLGLSL